MIPRPAEPAVSLARCFAPEGLGMSQTTSGLQDAAQGQLQSGVGNGLFQPSGGLEYPVDPWGIGGPSGDREKGNMTRGQFFRQREAKSVLQLHVKDRRIGIVGVQPLAG